MNFTVHQPAAIPMVTVATAIEQVPEASGAQAISIGHVSVLESRACVPCSRLKTKCDFTRRPCPACVHRGTQMQCLADANVARRACAPCRKSKRNCDKQRPCLRCKRAGKPELCQSYVSTKAAKHLNLPENKVHIIESKESPPSLPAITPIIATTAMLPTASQPTTVIQQQNSMVTFQPTYAGGYQVAPVAMHGFQAIHPQMQTIIASSAPQDIKPIINLDNLVATSQMMMATSVQEQTVSTPSAHEQTAANQSTAEHSGSATSSSAHSPVSAASIHADSRSQPTQPVDASAIVVKLQEDATVRSAGSGTHQAQPISEMKQVVTPPPATIQQFQSFIPVLAAPTQQMYIQSQTTAGPTQFQVFNSGQVNFIPTFVPTGGFQMTTNAFQGNYAIFDANTGQIIPQVYSNPSQMAIVASPQQQFPTGFQVVTLPTNSIQQ
jgi:hypothetical protein